MAAWARSFSPVPRQEWAMRFDSWARGVIAAAIAVIVAAAYVAVLVSALSNSYAGM
jgi:hypothetical protein